MEPDESTTAQNAGEAQLMAALAREPSWNTAASDPQVPDCHVETVPSERATLQKEVVGHETE